MLFKFLIYFYSFIKLSFISFNDLYFLAVNSDFQRTYVAIWSLVCFISSFILSILHYFALYLFPHFFSVTKLFFLCYILAYIFKTAFTLKIHLTISSLYQIHCYFYSSLNSFFSISFPTCLQQFFPPKYVWNIFFIFHIFLYLLILIYFIYLMMI